jgi:hypothetical protein
MSYSASPVQPPRVRRGLFHQASRIAIAAALFGALLAFAPAMAGEHDGVRRHSGPSNVPGEGPPYVDHLNPRGGWPSSKSYYRSPKNYDERPDVGFTKSPIQGPPYLDHLNPVGWPPMPERKPRSYIVQDEDNGSDGYFHDAPRPSKKHDYTKYEKEEPNEERGHHYGGEPEPEPDYAENGDYAPEKGDGFGRLFPSAQEHGKDAYRSASYKALQRLGRSMKEEYEPNDPAGDGETPAGYTFLGQFIDHDLTLDTTTDLGREIKGDHELENARTPDLDLDSVYGGGPARSPHLYRLPYLRIGRAIAHEGDTPRYDLFRAKASYRSGPSGGEPTALLGDPRNDENIIISQLHAAFIAFHNRTVDILIERDYGRERGSFCQEDTDCGPHVLAEELPGDAKQKIFQIAHDHVIHYYHRLIVEDFLPRMIGVRHTLNLLRHGRDFYFPQGFRDGEGNVRNVHIPVEFAAAAFRFGHSQVRDSYILREGVRFDLLSDGEEGPRAFQPVTKQYLADWRYFFDIDGHRPYGFNYARRLDPELVSSLHRLDFANVVGKHEVTSLAARNLARGKTLHLPSGQEVARIVLPALEARGLLGKGRRHGYEGHEGAFWREYLLQPDDRVAHFLGEAETPLWYYILQEAGIFGTRTHLRAAPYDGEDVETSGDFRRKGYGPLVHEASARGKYRRYDAEQRDGYNGPDAGHRLGPVGAAIVGEVLTGLVDHYREKTGKGLDYRPEIKGSASSFAGLSGHGHDGHRYLMRNFLIDAGVVGEH